MKNQIKNYGIDLKKEEREHTKEDWLFGIAKELKGLAENINFKKYLPIGEVQRGREDMVDCATRGPINILETKLTYLYQNNLLHYSNKIWLEKNGYIQDNRVVLADAFNAILSATTRSGNSMKAPIHSTHNDGCISKSLMPLEKSMRWADYHDQKRITKKILDLGKEFKERFPINYFRFNKVDFKNIIEYDMVDVAGYAWSIPINGIYPRINRRPNHIYVYFEKPAYQIFDNYLDRGIAGDFIKTLAPNYLLYNWGYRIIINQKIMVSLYRLKNKPEVVIDFKDVGINRQYWYRDIKDIDCYIKAGWVSWDDVQVVDEFPFDYKGLIIGASDLSELIKERVNQAPQCKGLREE